MAKQNSTNSDWFGFAWLTDDYVPPTETKDNVNEDDNGKAAAETDSKEQNDSTPTLGETKSTPESDDVTDDVKQTTCLETSHSVEGTSSETVALQNMTGIKTKKKLARSNNPGFTPPTTPTKSSKAASLQLLDSPPSVTLSPLKTSSVESSPVSKCSVVLRKNPILENLPRQNSIENVFAYVNDKIEMKTDSGSESLLERKRKLSSSESDSSVSSVKRQNSCDKKTDVMIFNTGIVVRKSGRLKSAKCSSRYRGDYGIRAEVVTKLSNIKNSDDENKLTKEVESSNDVTDVSVDEEKYKQKDKNSSQVEVERQVRSRSEQEEEVNQTLEAKSQMNNENEPCAVNIDQWSESKLKHVSNTENENIDKVKNVKNQKDKELSAIHNETNVEPVNNQSQYKDASKSDSKNSLNEGSSDEHQDKGTSQSPQKGNGSEFANSQNSDKIKTHKALKSKESETKKQTSSNLTQESDESFSVSQETAVFKPDSTSRVKSHCKRNDSKQTRLNVKQTEESGKKKVGPKLRTHITLQTGVTDKDTENIISSEEESGQIVSEKVAYNKSDNIVNAQSGGTNIDENVSVVNDIINDSMTDEIKLSQIGGNGFKANETCSSSEFQRIPAVEEQSKCQETVSLEVCDNVHNVPSNQTNIQHSDIDKPRKGHKFPVSSLIHETQICEEIKQKPLKNVSASRTIHKSSLPAQTTDRSERRANAGSYSHSISRLVSKQKQQIKEKSLEGRIKTIPSVDRPESIPSLAESEEALPDDSSVSVLESLRLRLFASAGVNPVEVVDKPKVFESKIKQPKVKTSPDLNKVSDKMSDQEFKLQHNNDFSLKNLNKTVIDYESNKSIHFSSRSSNISGHSTPRSSSPNSEILEEVSKNLESLQKAKRKRDRPLVQKPKRQRFEQKKFLLRSMVPKPAESDSDSHSNVSSVDSEDSVRDTGKQKKQTKSTTQTDNKKKQAVPSSKGKVVAGSKTNVKYSRLRDNKTPKSSARKQLVKPKPAKCHACGHVFKNKDLLKKHYPCRMRQTRTWSQNKLRPNRVFRYVDAPPKEQGRKRFICLLPKSKKQDPDKPRPQLLTVRKPKFKRVKGKRRRKLYMVLQELAEKRRPKTYPHLCVNYENMNTKSQFFYKLGLFSPTITEHSCALDFLHPKVETLKEGNKEHDKENIFEGSETLLGLDSNLRSMQHLPKGYETLTYDRFQKSQSVYTIPIEQLAKEMTDAGQINFVENADINPLNTLKHKQTSLSVHGTETPPLLEKFEMPGDLVELNDKSVVVHKDTNEPPVLEIQFESPKKQQTERHFLDFAVDQSNKGSNEIQGSQSTDDLNNEEFKLSVRNITKLKDSSISQTKNTVQRHFTDIIEVAEISAKREDRPFSNDSALWEQSEKGEMTLSEIREILKPQSRMENAFSKESLLKLRSDLAKLLAKVKTPVKSDTRPAVHTAELLSDNQGIEALDIDFSAYERKSLFESLENVEASSFTRQVSLDETGGSSSGSETSSSEHSDPYKSSLDYEQDLLPPTYEMDNMDSTTKGCITDNILQMLNTLEDKGSVAENMSNLLQILAENLGIIDSSKQNKSGEDSGAEKLEVTGQTSNGSGDEKHVPENIFETEESYKFKADGSEKIKECHQSVVNEHPHEEPDYKKEIGKESTLFKSITELNSIETDSDSNLGESYDVDTMSRRLAELKAAHCDASASDINSDALSDYKDDDDSASETTSEKYKENIEGKIKPLKINSDKDELLVVERPIVSVSPTAVAYDSDIGGSGEESNRTIEERPRLIMKIKIPAGASFETSDDNSSHKDSSSCTSASVKSSDVSDAEEVGKSEYDTLVEVDTSITDEASKTIIEQEDRDVIPCVETSEVDAEMNKLVVLQDDAVVTPYADAEVEGRPSITNTPDKSITNQHIEMIQNAGGSAETLCEVLPFARRLKLNTALTIGDSFDYESDSSSSFERDVAVVPKVGTSPKATDDSFKIDEKAIKGADFSDSKLMINEEQFPKSISHQDISSIMPSVEITQSSTIDSNAIEKANAVETPQVIDNTTCYKSDDKHKVSIVALLSASKDHNLKDANQAPENPQLSNTNIERVNMKSNHIVTVTDGERKSLEKVNDEGEIPENVESGINRNTKLCKYPESHTDAVITEEQTLSINSKVSCNVESVINTSIQGAQTGSEKIQEMGLSIQPVQESPVENLLMEMQTEEKFESSEEATGKISHAQGTAGQQSIIRSDKSFSEEKTSVEISNKLDVNVTLNYEVSGNHEMPQINEVNSDLVECSATMTSINDSYEFVNDFVRMADDDEPRKVNEVKLSPEHQTVTQKHPENIGMDTSKHSVIESAFHTSDIQTSSDKNNYRKQHKTTNNSSDSKNHKIGVHAHAKNEGHSDKRKRDSKSKVLKDVKGNRTSSRPVEKTDKAGSRSVESKYKTKESDTKKNATNGNLQKSKSDKPKKSVQNAKSKIYPEENQKNIVAQSDVKKVDEAEVSLKVKLSKADSDQNDIKKQTANDNVEENKPDKVETSIQGTTTNFQNEKNEENKKSKVAQSVVKKADEVKVNVKGKLSKTDSDYIDIKTPLLENDLQEQKSDTKMIKDKEGRMNIIANSESQLKSNLKGNTVFDESKKDTESNKRRRISVTDYLSRVKRRESTKQSEDEIVKVPTRSSKASMSSENNPENSSKSAPDIVIDENMYDVNQASQNWHNPSVYVKKTHSESISASNQTKKTVLGFSDTKEKLKIKSTVDSLDSLFPIDEMPSQEEEKSNRFVAMPLTKKSDIMSIENKTFPMAESTNKSIVGSKQNVIEETKPFKEIEVTKSDDDVLDVFDSLFSLGETVLSLNKTELNHEENETVKTEDDGNLFNTIESLYKVGEGIMKKTTAEKEVNEPSSEHEVTEVIDLTETLDDSLTEEREGKSRGLFLDFTDWLTQSDNAGAIILGKHTNESENRKNEHTICTVPGDYLTQMNGFSGVHLNRFRYNIFDFEEEYFEISAKTERNEINPVVAVSAAIEKEAQLMAYNSNPDILETVSNVNTSMSKSLHKDHGQHIHTLQEDNDVTNSDNEGYEDDDFADMLAAQMAINEEAMSQNVSGLAEEKISVNTATLYEENTSTDSSENVAVLSGGKPTVVSPDRIAVLSVENASFESVAVLGEKNAPVMSSETTARLSEEKSLEISRPVIDLPGNRIPTENLDTFSENPKNGAALSKETGTSQKKAEVLLEENLVRDHEHITAGLMKIKTLREQEEVVAAKAKEKVLREHEEVAAAKAKEKALREQEEVAATKAKERALREQEIAAAKAKERALREQEEIAAAKAQEKAVREQEEVAAAKAQERALREQEEIAAAKAQERAFREQEEIAATNEQEKALREQEEIAAAKAQVRALREQEEVAAAKAKERALKEQEEIAAAKAKERALREQEEIAAALEEERAYLEYVEKATVVAGEVKQSQEEAAAPVAGKSKGSKKKKHATLGTEDKAAALSAGEMFIASQEKTAGNKDWGILGNKLKAAALAAGKTASREKTSVLENKDDAAGMAYIASGEKAAALKNKDEAATLITGGTCIASQGKAAVSGNKKVKPESQKNAAQLAVAKAAALAEAKNLINRLVAEENTSSVKSKKSATVSKVNASTVKQEESPNASKVETSVMSREKAAALSVVQATTEHQGNIDALLKRDTYKTAKSCGGQNIDYGKERLGSVVNTQHSLVSTDYDAISDETSSEEDSQSGTSHKRKFGDTTVKNTEGIGPQRITEPGNRIPKMGQTNWDVNESGVKRQKIGSATYYDEHKFRTSYERPQASAREANYWSFSKKHKSHSKKKSKTKSKKKSKSRYR